MSFRKRYIIGEHRLSFVGLKAIWAHHLSCKFQTGSVFIRRSGLRSICTSIFIEVKALGEGNRLIFFPLELLKLFFSTSSVIEPRELFLFLLFLGTVLDLKMLTGLGCGFC